MQIFPNISTSCAVDLKRLVPGSIGGFKGPLSSFVDITEPETLNVFHSFRGEKISYEKRETERTEESPEEGDTA